MGGGDKDVIHTLFMGAHGKEGSQLQLCIIISIITVRGHVSL